MNIEEKIKELLEEDFYKITDIVFKDLYDNNKEFIKLRNNINKLLDKYPHISSIYNKDLTYKFSKEEINALKKYLKYKKREEEIYQEQLLYTGVRVAYIVFKKAGMIKE